MNSFHRGLLFSFSYCLLFVFLVEGGGGAGGSHAGGSANPSPFPLPGGWVRLNINDQNAAWSANYVATQKRATIVVIRKVEQQNSYGVNYRFLMDLKDNSGTFTVETVVHQDTEYYDTNTILTIESYTMTTPLRCPACPVLTITNYDSQCYGGPRDGCNCCTGTGESVAPLSPSSTLFPPPSPAPTTVGYQICVTQARGTQRCTRYATYFDCLNAISACRSSGTGGGCGSCTPAYQ